MSNRYFELTKKFNFGHKRVVVASGQAVVLHRLAIMSKDCDWILREDQESFAVILRVLSELGASYRFGAPLDLAWHKEGWSSHFELFESGLRLRLDFFSRPPRLSDSDLAEIWSAAEDQDLPFINKELLVKQKFTDRLKDYAVIGDLVRSMNNENTTLRYGQSASDILSLILSSPTAAKKLSQLRPALVGVDFSAADAELQIRLAIERERYDLMRLNLTRIAAYREASATWAKYWPKLQQEIKGMKLEAAHDIILGAAQKMLPKQVTI